MDLIDEDVVTKTFYRFQTHYFYALQHPDTILLNLLIAYTLYHITYMQSYSTKIFNNRTIFSREKDQWRSKKLTVGPRGPYQIVQRTLKIHIRQKSGGGMGFFRMGSRFYELLAFFLIKIGQKLRNSIRLTKCNIFFSQTIQRLRE